MKNAPPLGLRSPAAAIVPAACCEGLPSQNPTSNLSPHPGRRLPKPESGSRQPQSKDYFFFAFNRPRSLKKLLALAMEFPRVLLPESAGLLLEVPPRVRLAR